MNQQPESKVLRINFSRRLVSLGGGLYTIKGRKKTFYARPRFLGKQWKQKLPATTEKFARIELAKLEDAIIKFKAGQGPNPLVKKAPDKTLSELADFYLDKKCPKKSPGQRTKQTQLEEERRVATIKLWPGAKRIGLEANLAWVTEFHAWRIPLITRGKGGDRQVDKELVTMSNIFRCAMRHPHDTGITSNPISKERIRFRQPSKVLHCRDQMPRDAEELHSLFRRFFAERESESTGWAAVFESLTAQRISEIIKLRVDGTSKSAPGFVDRKKLYTYRSETSKGTYGHVVIHPALEKALEMHAIWHKTRFPDSPWYFPSPRDPSKPIKPGALTARLSKWRKLGLIAHRTSHGLRAYCVNVWRSMKNEDGSRKYTDAEIALWIGQKTGGKLIVEVYGEGLDYEISWLPSSSRPAWEDLLDSMKGYAVQLSLL